MTSDARREPAPNQHVGAKYKATQDHFEANGFDGLEEGTNLGDPPLWGAFKLCLACAWPAFDLRLTCV